MPPTPSLCMEPWAKHCCSLHPQNVGTWSAGAIVVLPLRCHSCSTQQRWGSTALHQVEGLRLPFPSHCVAFFKSYLQRKIKITSCFGDCKALAGHSAQPQGS